MKFRTWLTLAVIALATMPLIFGSVMLASAIERQARTSAQRELGLAAGRAADAVGARLSLLVSEARALGSDSDIHRGVKSLLFMNRADTLLGDFLRRNEIAGSVHLLDAEGGRFVTASPLAMLDWPLTAELSAAMPGPNAMLVKDPQALAKWRGLLVREGRAVEEGEPPVLAMVLPVPGLLGRTAGSMVILVSAGTLARIAADAAPPTDAIELRWADESVAAGRSLPTATAGEAGSDVLSATAAMPKLAAATGILLPLSVRVVEPGTIRFEEMRRARLLLVLTSLAAIALAAAAAWHLARRAVQHHLSVLTEEERRKAEIERAQIQAELDAMRSQMNPHFLFNSMNSIATMIAVEPSAAVTMISRLADLLRAVVDGGRQGTWALTRELDVVRSYLELESVRFGSRLDWRVEVAEDLGAAQVPALVLQTLAENAVKHGIAKAREGGKVVVSVLRDAESQGYWAEVRNGGAAYTGDKPGAAGGTGLANTRKRLALLYGTRHELTIEGQSNGETVVRFWFSGKSA